MSSVNRRSFLKGSVTTAISGQPLLAQSAASLATASPQGIVDTHVYVSRRPTRRMLGDAPELVDMLRKSGVTQDV